MNKAVLFFLITHSIGVCAQNTASSYQEVASHDISNPSPVRPSVHSVSYLSPYNKHEAVAKTYIGTGRTITDYAIRSNDTDLMRLLGVTTKSVPVKPAEDTAALKRLAIEEAQEYLPKPNYYAVIKKPEKTQVVLQEKPVAIENTAAIEEIV